MPQLAVFSAKPYDRLYLTSGRASELLESSTSGALEIVHHEFALSVDTVSALHKDTLAVCVFVNDTVDAAVLGALSEHGVKAVLLRCAGFNNVDLKTAEQLGLHVANVPAYSPEAVAEFAVALIQTLNRNTHRAYNRVREANFNLAGLLGKTLRGKTVGVIGTGRIGVAFAKIMGAGFGCRIVAFDPFENDELKKYGEYVKELDELLPQCDIISLHCPLMDNTKHIMNKSTLQKMKTGAILVNTSRGGLIDTKAVIASLKSRKLGGLALDVYEGEGGLFYHDHSGTIIEDDELMRLTTFHNVLVCGHQAFFTEEALREIADCTIKNMAEFVSGGDCSHALVGKPQRKHSIPLRT
ncbi:putative D-lactate dehydrogenase [Microdochium trichocladiopsis]|uniref:D-lactate dehydrogenase n=1 Tax=Microdochium trichocladiopsis TaxID=1682393 RepID=A0A9P8Y894_9PEZI|nr:putative D-lactate dehydrogenase [Microdochium trichocladiopsis]KAH7034774.1 putative D-lactate dehydrogenase [Microdochium trichocladiopsis]